MSLLDGEHILNERSDSTVTAWAADYANEFISKMRFMGTVDSLPRLSEDMVGEVYLLKSDEDIETYIAIEDNLCRLSWRLLKKYR